MLTIHRHFQPDQAHPVHNDRSCLYLDIETTGLSRDRSILYLIGCGFPEDEGLHVILWFNDDGRSEMAMLKALSQLLSQNDRTLVTFNGNRFDLPCLKSHYEMYDLECPNMPSLDLYQLLRPFQHVFQLQRGRQTDWESCLGIAREDAMSGRELIGIYRSWLKTRDEKLFDLLLLHNYEDVCHLSQIAPLSALPEIISGAFHLHEMSFSDQHQLIISCRSEHALPVDITKETRDGSIQIKGDRICLRLFTGPKLLKHFFPDPKNYYYLPGEDRAVHKSVAIYVDKDYREKCRPDNCYVCKEGIFIPVYSKDCMKAFTLYSPEYRSTVQYIDYDELSRAGEKVQHLFVQSFLAHHLL